MRRFIFQALAVACAIAVSPAVAQQHKAEDFLPPVQGGSEKIAEPDAVRVAQRTVHAATPQDAVNAAVAENVKQLGHDAKAVQETPELGARWVTFPSGAGIVATGLSTYSEMANPVAGRIAQRNAYVIAYTNAKAAMSRQLGSISNEGRTVLETIARQNHGADRVEQGSAEEVKELVEQSAAALLKGYVTYSIQEQQDEANPQLRYVYVTIASTSKTQTMVSRQGATQSVDKLVTGIQNTLDEVQRQLVPPVGGRVIVTPSGDTALIAFGSAVVGVSSNPAAQARLRLEAQRIAAVRARDALAGILQGDQVLWSSGVASKAVTGFEEVMTYAKSDPTAVTSEETLESTTQEFLSSEVLHEAISSVRSGTLPPGIQERHWLDEDGHWATSMMVYYPKISDAAKKFAQDMKAAQLIPQPGSAANPKATRSLDNRVPVRPGGKIGSDNGL